MGNKREILVQEAERIRAKIEKWVKQNLPFNSDGFVTLMLTIKRKEPTVVIKQVSIHSKKPRLKITERPITDEDWKKIFSISFPFRQKSILGFFKKNNNKPLSVKEMESLLAQNDFKDNYLFSYSYIRSLNSIFRKARTNYCLRMLSREEGSGHAWPEKLFKLAIIKEE